MKIEATEGNGLISFQPTKTESISFSAGECTPFDGEGCLLHLNAASAIEVMLLEDTAYRVINVPFAGFAPMLVKSVKNTNDYANIEFAAR